LIPRGAGNQEIKLHRPERLATGGAGAPCSPSIIGHHLIDVFTCIIPTGVLEISGAVLFVIDHSRFSPPSIEVAASISLVWPSIK
jgi:hypothetical protein